MEDGVQEFRVIGFFGFFAFSSRTTKSVNLVARSRRGFGLREVSSVFGKGRQRDLMRCGKMLGNRCIS